MSSGFISQIDPRAYGALAHGAAALGAGLGGYNTGYAHPESHHSGPGALFNMGVAAIPGAIMGGSHGAALSAALGYMAYRGGHGLGRQAATNYMLGPGVNANTISWHRYPGT